MEAGLVTAPLDDTTTPPDVRRISRERRRPAFVVGTVWMLIALAAMVAIYGGPGHKAQQSPDEAAIAYGIELVAEGGVARTPQPWDHPLARQRLWVVRDDGLITPAYPMAPMLLHGFIRRAPFGAWSLFLLPAAGLGAFVAAVALLLPRWRWMAGVVPLVAAPATFWWIRPWSNISQSLGLVGLMTLALAVHWLTGRTRWGVVGLGLLALAGAVRPDQVHVFAALTLLATVGRPDARRWRWVGAHVGAAGLWVLLVMGTNVLSTGGALTTPVDLQTFSADVLPAAFDYPTPLKQIMTIVAYQGLVPVQDVARWLWRYGFSWTIGFGVAVGGLAGAAAFVGRTMPDGPPRWLRAGFVGTILWYAISRVSLEDYGSEFDYAAPNHNYPRYTAVALAVLAALAVWGAVSASPRWRSVLSAGLVVAGLVAGVEVVRPNGEIETVYRVDARLDDANEYAADVASQLSPNGVLLAWRVDKYVWGVAPTGILNEEFPPEGSDRVDIVMTAASIRAAIEAGRVPHLLEVEGQIMADVQDELGDDYVITNLPLTVMRHLEMYRVERAR